MAKQITLQIRLTEKQVQWLTSRAAALGHDKVAPWARAELLSQAPADVREDKGRPLQKGD